MRVLVACEYSGTVRDAFAKLGHDAWSCDILPTDAPGQHYQCDIMEVLGKGWDLMIAFPPCTHLAVSGARHFAKKRADGRQQQGIDFFLQIINANIPKIVVENPVGIMSTLYRKPDQIIQPWQFGDTAQKTTCLWLKDMPPLQHTNIVDKGEFYTAPSGKRLPKWYSDNKSAKARSKTFQGIADAMAQQWGSPCGS
jgi:site-specific DNA-cytosine methylase